MESNESRKSRYAELREKLKLEEEENLSKDEEIDSLYVPLIEKKKRIIEKHLKHLAALSDTNDDSSHHSHDSHGSNSNDALIGPGCHLSLLDQHNELKKKAEQLKESDREKQLKEEQKILESVAQAKALMSIQEIAKGIQYLDPTKTSWKPPKCILKRTTSKT
jgi:ATP-dependent RNA helicase DDX41